MLLQLDEISLAVPMIYRLLTNDSITRRPGWYHENIQSVNRLSESEVYSSLVDSLRALVNGLRSKSPNLNQLLNNSNIRLNQFFSDLGWREVRKEISQIKKRQKKAHIEVSKDIINRLKLYMDQEKFDSFDQALDNLLSEYAASNLEIEESYQPGEPHFSAI
ncbi:hypothetical protein [Shewanella sp. GXUN23E]|uniref:hypothetical protein n=1 Tax=Shewanella sp. GXUN23E TaxID=3422498 RepID=UPI003D7D8897